MLGLGLVRPINGCVCSRAQQGLNHVSRHEVSVTAGRLDTCMRLVGASGSRSFSFLGREDAKYLLMRVGILFVNYAITG